MSPAPAPDRGRVVTCAAALLAASLVLTACSVPTSLRGGRISPDDDDVTTVLLVKPDIQLTELTAAGIEQPMAEWTVAGIGNVEQALADFMARRRAAMVPYQPPDDDPGQLDEHSQLLKLHRMVGKSIEYHMYDQFFALPTKPTLDWSLGEGARTLGADNGADYALFIYLRDSYATTGRLAAMALMAFLYRAPVMQGGVQAGFASLVDLRTGDVVWFNHLSRSTGDLRTPEPAREAIEILLYGIPL